MEKLRRQYEYENNLLDYRQKKDYLASSSIIMICTYLNNRQNLTTCNQQSIFNHAFYRTNRGRLTNIACTIQIHEMMGKISRTLMSSESSADSNGFVDRCYEPRHKLHELIDLLIQIIAFHYLYVMGRVQGHMSQDFYDKFPRSIISIY